MRSASGIDIPVTLEEAVFPPRTGLIVYDMQAGILRQLRHAEKLVRNVGRVLDAARAANLRTYFMRHMSLPRNLMGRFQMRQALAWQRKDDPAEVVPWFPRGSPVSEITPELVPRDTEAVFDKLGMSAFEGTPLDFALRDCDVCTILIVGVATEIGIEPTVRQAADLGYIPVVIEDACGAGHEEAGQRAIESMRYMGDALFTTVDEITGLLS